jgi:hypothetical protein
MEELYKEYYLLMKHLHLSLGEIMSIDNNERKALIKALNLKI